MVLRNALEDMATEATLADVLAQLDDATADTVLSVLKLVHSEVAGLTTQTDALTDAELRSSEVGVVDAEVRTALGDIKRSITDYTTKLDYGARADGNPVYVGKAPQGTAASAASWTTQKLTYDGSDRLIEVQVLSDVVWDDRATLGWT